MASRSKSGVSWHTIARMAAFFKKSQRTISSWLEELEELQLIERRQWRVKGPAFTILRPYPLAADSLAGRILSLRVRRRQTGQELAEEAGLSVDRVRRLELENNANPTHEELRSLSSALRVTPGFLVDGFSPRVKAGTLPKKAQPDADPWEKELGGIGYQQ